MILLYDEKNNLDVNKVEYINMGVSSGTDMGDVIRFNLGASRIIMSYDVELNKDDVKYLIDRGSKILEEYIRNRYNFEEEAEQPEWVDKKEGEDITMLKSVGVGDIQDYHFDKVYEAFDDLVEMDNYDSEDDDDIKVNGAIIKKQFKKSDALFAYLSMFSEGDVDSDKLADSLQQFRIWGPINRGEVEFCCGAPNGIGPHRMLYCNCFDGDEDKEVDSGYDWFDGRCDNCGKKIGNKARSIRRPIVGGGWKGCYCSEKCLREDCVFGDKQEDILIRKMLEDLKENGIMDRGL